MTEQSRQHAIRLRLARMSEGRPVTVLPTGLAPLDAALGVGGLPRGGIVELFGPPASGKTTLALQAIAYLQGAGASAAWIDAEHSFDPAYAATLGVDIGRLPVARPETAEQAIEMARRLAVSGAVDLLVVDSAAALVPRLELEAGIGESSLGLQSRVLGSGLRMLSKAVAKSAASVLFLNQTRVRPESGGGETVTSAGGPSLKLYAAVRVVLSPAGRAQIRFRVLKNKAAAAFAEGTLGWKPGVGFVETP